MSGAADAAANSNSAAELHQLHRRLARARERPEWSAYLNAREKVLRIKSLERVRRVAADTPSEYWTEELAGFDYLLDASPLMISKLRHQCYHVTGIKDYDYRSHHQARGAELLKKLSVLEQLAERELLVPENPALGGFGFERDGELFNIDTLKFFEVLIAMQRGGVLSPIREAQDRPFVVEIGAGWGGFAYQFKTVCPATTYCIVDLPELFLFSATYLRTIFPDARFVFYGDDDVPAEDLLASAHDADFVFVPHTAVEELRPPRLDLALNMVSFQEMTFEQVRRYANWAADSGARYLYSLNRARSPYNTQLTTVSEILSERFRLHEVPILPISYTQMLPKGMRSPLIRTKIKRRGGMPYQHMIGWSQ